MATRPDIIPIDPETGLEQEDIGGAGPSAEPFDPTDVRIETTTPTVDQLVSRLADGGIDPAPGIARGADWTETAQSRLIESLLVRVPVPAFYFDASGGARWRVIDGLHRLSALDGFINAGTLRLSGLEFLDHLEGKAFRRLPRHFQRRILETQVTAHLVQEGTPDALRFALFRRLNTAAPRLAAQEMRHILHPGQATELLGRLAGGKAFAAATGGGVGAVRMADRECVLRFLAFLLVPHGEYSGGDLDLFLSEAMAALNALEAGHLAGLEAAFERAMTAAGDIFGGDAFRRPAGADEARPPVNKGLFEAWSVALAALDADGLARVVERRDALKEEFTKLLNKDKSFAAAISTGTGDAGQVSRRFAEIEKLIERIRA